MLNGHPHIDRIVKLTSAIRQERIFIFNSSRTMSAPADCRWHAGGGEKP